MLEIIVGGVREVCGDTYHKKPSTLSSLAGLLAISDIQGGISVLLRQEIDSSIFLPPKIHGSYS